MTEKRLIVLVSGPVASGKSSLVRKIQDSYGAVVFTTREWLIQSVRESGLATADRRTLQAEGERYDALTKGRWVMDMLVKALKPLPDATMVVLDSVRTKDQVAGIRTTFGAAVLHVHVTAPLWVLSARYEARRRIMSDELPSYDEVRANSTEAQVDSLGEIADLVIDTSVDDVDQAFSKAAHLIRHAA